MWKQSPQYFRDYLTVIFLCISFYLPATNVDSLLHVLSKVQSDSLKIETLNNLAWELKYSNPDTAMHYALSALQLSEKVKFAKGKGDASNNLGVITYLQGEFSPALDYLQKALAIRLQYGDKKGVAKNFNNLGLIHYELDNYPKALNYYLSSLKISEELDHKPGIAASLNNIGNIYIRQENYQRALEYFLRSVEINKAFNDKQGLANNYNNLGIIYANSNSQLTNTLADSSRAIYYYFKALSINREIDNHAEVNNILINIGNYYMQINSYSEAYHYLSRALKNKREIGDDRGEPSILLNLGYIFLSKRQHVKALYYMQLCLSKSQSIASLDDIKEAYRGLTDVYEAMDNKAKAYNSFKSYVNLRDSILSAENNDKITNLHLVYETEKKDKEIQMIKDNNRLKAALSRAEIKKQRLLRNAFVGGFGVVLIFSVIILRQRNRVAHEKERSDHLLLNILPVETAQELKATGKAEAKTFDMVTVMFTDFKNFTQTSEAMSALDLVAEINNCYSAFDEIVYRHGIEKIKTIGDSYMCAGGLPVKNATHAIDVVKSALEICEFMRQRKSLNHNAFDIRIGIHTGPVVAGIVGTKKFAYDIWGDTVNIASRMESSGEEGKVNISGTTYELVKDKFSCIHRGKIEAKNKGMIDMYFVDSIT